VRRLIGILGVDLGLGLVPKANIVALGHTGTLPQFMGALAYALLARRGIGFIGH
jgi:hypothetical protein